MSGMAPTPPLLRIEPTGTHDFGSCPCCGGNSRAVWGSLRRGDPTEAVYYVHWTKDKVWRHGAHFDFVIGPWGEGTSAEDRVGVCLEFRRTERGPEFMVIDASSREKYFGDLAARLLARKEVMGTPLAKQAFEFVDAIWLQDPRIAEITTPEDSPFPA